MFLVSLGPEVIALQHVSIFTLALNIPEFSCAGLVFHSVRAIADLSGLVIVYFSDFLFSHCLVTLINQFSAVLSPDLY